MKNITKIVFVVLSLCILNHMNAFANEFYHLSTDLSKFPNVEISGILINQNNFVRIEQNSVSLSENLVPITTKTVECNSNNINAKPFSLAILIDASASMNDHYRNYIKSELTTLFSQFDFTNSEIALIAFNSNPYLIQDYTSDFNKLINSLDNINFSGSSDLNSAFLSTDLSIIKLIENASYQSSIILLNNGISISDNTNVIIELNKLNVRFNSISLNFPVSNTINEIASVTGGFSVLVSNTADFLSSIFALSYYTKYDNFCKISYKSISCKNNNDLNIGFSDILKNYNFGFYVEDVKFPRLIIEPSYFYYGNINPPSKPKNTFKITAVGGDVVVNNFINTSKFKIVGNITPFLQKNGTSSNIEIRYEPTDSNYIFEELFINSSSCKTSNFLLAGGSDRTSNINKTLRIVKPNGGELIFSGSSYIIEWQGVLPTDTVQIDYSIDGGKNWILITNSGTRLKYNWNFAPSTLSTDCLLRIRHLSKYDLSKNIISLKGIQGNIVNLIWNKGHNEVYTGSTDGFVRLWNALNGEPVKTIAGDIQNIRFFDFSPDYKYFAILTDGSDEFLVRNSQNQFEEFKFITSGEVISHLIWNPKNNLILSATKSNKLYLWNFPSNTPVKKMDLSSAVSAIKWDNNGDKFAIGHENGFVTVWDQSGNNISEFKAGDQRIISLDFNPTSKVLVTSSLNELIKIWDLESSSNVTSFVNNYKPVNNVSWDPAATYISSASIDSSIVLWLPGSGKIHYTFKGHNNFVNLIKWNYDGSKIASSTSQGEVFIWSPMDIPFNRPTLQEAVSETTWSIISPNLEIKNVVFRSVQFGRSRDTVVKDIMKNKSQADIQIDTIFIRGHSNSYILPNEMPNFPWVLKANSNLDLMIRFSPFSTNTQSDTIVYISGSRVYRSILTGFVTKPIISISPNVYDFGIVKVGSVSNKLNIKIKNLSQEDIFIESVDEIFNSNSQFKIVDFEPGFLSAGSEAEFVIEFHPNTFFGSSALFDLIYDGKTEPDYISLIGSGAAPQIKYTSIINIPSIVCENSTSEEIKLYNTGNEKLNINSIELTQGSDNYFSLDLTNTKFILQEGDSTTLLLIFSTLKSGNYAADIKISSDVNADRSVENFIHLKSEKLNSSYKLSEDNIQFFIYDINTSETKSFHIFNNGDVPIKWIFPVDYENFTIEDISPSVTKPNDSSVVKVKFKGSANFGSYSQEHYFTDSCDQIQNITFNAYIGPNLSEISTNKSINCPEIICELDSSFQKLVIKNIGPTPLYISKIAFTNKPTSFYLEGNYSNINIPSNEEFEITIKFRPNISGLNFDTLKIQSNALNTDKGETNVIVNGFWSNADFDITPRLINFIKLLENEKIHSAFDVINTGYLTLKWNFVPDFNYIVIDSIVPQETKPGEISRFYFTFKGGKFGSTLSEKVKLSNICSTLDSISLTFDIDGTAKTAIKAGNISGKPGDTLEIPIKIFSADGSALPDAGFYKTTISFNSTILVPLEQNMGMVTNGNRTIHLQIPAIKNDADTIVFNYKVLATLGNKEYSEIEISNTEAVGTNQVRILEINGSMALDTISTENGVRLIGNSGYLKLSQNMPNPVTDLTKIKFSTIETGFHRVIIYDLLGNESKVLLSENIAAGDYEISINLDSLPIGNYVYALITPSQKLTRKLTILR